MHGANMKIVLTIFGITQSGYIYKPQPPGALEEHFIIHALKLP